MRASLPAYDSQRIQMAGMEERERLDSLGLPGKMLHPALL